MPADRPTVAVDLRALVPEATGIGVYTREMVRHLAALGGFDYLGLAHREPRGAEELRSLGMRIEHQGAPLGVLWQQLRLPRRLGRGDADLLWSPLQTLPRSSRVPAVVTVHDLTVLLMPDAHRAKVRWSQIPFLAGSLARARRVVADSEATASDLRFHFPQAFQAAPGKLRVVYPGVSAAFRPADRDERQAIREELGTPEGYLLYAGTLEPRKNVEGVLDAWLALRADDPATPPLVLAGGKGWQSGALIRKIGRIHGAGSRQEGSDLQVLGRVDDARLARLYRGATVFVYPSFYEGFGLPVVEAMASGTPVVTSDRASLPEVAGDAALTVRPEDPSIIAGAIRHLLANPQLAQELVEKGIERARTFRWDEAAREMEEVFRETLE